MSLLLSILATILKTAWPALVVIALLRLVRFVAHRVNQFMKR